MPMETVLSAGTTFLTSSEVGPVVISVSTGPAVSMLVKRSPPSSAVVCKEEHEGYSHSVGDAIRRVIPVLVAYSLTDFSTITTAI